MSILGKFEVVDLGIHHSDYFQGFGSEGYDNSCVGIGVTEEAALEDCMEMMAQSGSIDLDEERIRDEYGETDDSTTCDDCDGTPSDNGCAGCDSYYHIGIRWNIKEEDRLRRIKAIEGIEMLRYENYTNIERSQEHLGLWAWGYERRADGSCSYGDFHSIDLLVNAEDYLNNLCEDIEKTNEVYFFVPYATGSDYSGGTVERANAKCIEESFGENDWVHEVYGGHGTYAVAIGLTGLLRCEDDTFDEFCEILEGLADYPLIDEEAHSLLEMELADEAWNNYIRGDFEKALEDEHPDCEFNWPDDLRSFFEEKREKANEYWEAQTGGDMWIRIDDIVEKITFDDIEQWAVCYEVSWNDVGKQTETYYDEEDADQRAAKLRWDGVAGASYRKIEPDHLKIEAIQAAERRGHPMGPWIDFDDNRSRSACMVCAKKVDIIRKPQPNEINIGGPAVAMGCEK